MSRLLRTVFALVLLSLCFFPALAGEGRSPIWQPLTIGPGQEGKYILTRDVTAAIGMPVIDILPGTRAVDIDLNGFTLHGADMSIIRAIDVEELTVRNGALAGGALEGILTRKVRKVVIEDVKAGGQGGSGFLLREAGIVALRRNVVSGAVNDGIFVDNASGDQPVDGIIEDNQVKDCGSGITVLLGHSIAIENNRVAVTTLGDGIRVSECTACLVSENSVTGAMAVGIFFEGVRASKLYNNLVFKAQMEGIALMAGCEDTLVLNNVSSANSASGLVCVGSRNHIDRNVLTLNGMAGIFLTNSAVDNTFGRNTFRGNAAPPSGCMANPPGCFAPDVCVDGPGNDSFSDNMGPGPGC